MAGQTLEGRCEMSREVEVVGSISNAARNWHLAAGTILAARFGVKATPKSKPGGNGAGEAKPRPSA